MERSLKGKVALVTGAGTRVGRALALGLGQAGARVAVHFHGSRQGADETAAQLTAGGTAAATFQADLSDPGQLEPLVAAVEARLGPIAVLVNSAARFDRADFLETSLQLLEAEWAVNARAPYLLSQAVARRMVSRGGGDIVNIVDLGGGFDPWRHYSAYCMAKAALTMLTRCLALELAPAIRVNAVAPGTVLPPQALDLATLERLRQRIPAGRFGAPEDVVAAVRFFLEGPRFVTGQVLAVDGGRSLA